MTNKLKRLIAGLLAMVTMITAMPLIQVSAAKDGDKEQASLETLGKLGTVNIGSKNESGIWLQTQVDERPVFCLDLGKACHTGYTYVAKNSTISSDSSNKANALKAKIGYWFYKTKNGSNKAWVYAQCLIWAVEEGITSESGLKDIIKQVKSNTGYYSNDSIYSDIFDIATTVTCDITIWKYSGKTDSDEVQELMEIVVDTKEFQPTRVYESMFYRQRITLQKQDEDGNPLSQFKFRFTAKNTKELYSYKYNGWGDAVSDDVDDEATKFSQDVLTDSNGKITFRFTYKIQSKKYYYIPDDQLDEMSSDDKKNMKDQLDDLGYNYPSNLKKSSAEQMVQDDLVDQMNDISNQDVIEELSSGNENILSSFVVSQGSNKVTSQSSNKITVTLTKADSWTKNDDGDWPETADETYGNYKLAYKPVLKDKFKKVKLTVTKKDEETGEAQGDATLSGAVYGVYSDAACTKLIKSYKTDSNNQFETDYMRCGVNYYLKEITPPEGYLNNTKVYTIKEDGKEFTAEYSKDTTEVTDKPVKGYVAITKGMSNGLAGIVPFETNAQFQVYLASAGSYESAKETERDVLTTDLLGLAKSKALPYGTYVVHQILGAENTEKCADFYVNVTGNEKTYSYLLNNPVFEAYLKIVKKDSRTHQTVLKSGTTYQIYSVDKDGKETIVTQSHSNGNKIEVVDRFVSDDTGEILTYQKLPAGTYKIYEVEGPEGYKVNTVPVSVTISDGSYKTMVDANGKIYLYAECEYYNNETYGQFTLDKEGSVLYEVPEIMLMSDEGFEESESESIGNPFNYIDVALNGVVFELTAKEDIMSQDNQGTVLFKAGDKVADIVTGEGATFANSVDGICTSTLNDDGTITMTLPLGEYTLTETKTRYGYILLEQKSWDLSFKWNNSDDEYVFDTSENTTDGTISIHNDLVNTEINLSKKDSKTEKPIEGAVFGLYTKDNIYDINGNLVVAADTKLCDVTTDSEGKAHVPFDVPVMDEGYGETIGTLNSGDYYFLEESVSDSYFISEEPYYVHLEYKDQDTATVIADVTALENQTEVSIDKMMIASSVEIAGCKLKIIDTDGNEIVSWTTGDKDSIKFNEKLSEMGYVNFGAYIDENGSTIVNGLLHDKEYILTETKPADGYVTASDITFKIQQTVENADLKQEVLIKNGDEFISSESNKVVMYDDTTKVEFSKTDITGDKEIPGCKLKVTDKETGKVMDQWTSTENNHMVEGKYVVGKTYILTETKPADGYVTATDVEFTIKDDGSVQKVNMKDDTTKIQFNKITSDTNKQLKGAKYKVYDSKGKKVYEFTTGKKAEMIEGVFKIGETYTFKEVDAPKDYKLAKDVKITVEDTGKVQKLKAVDTKIPTVPDTPQTGSTTKIFELALSLIALIMAILCLVCLRAKDKSKYNFKSEDEDEKDI